MAAPKRRTSKMKQRTSAGAAFALKVIAVLRRYHVDLSSRFCSAKRLNLLEAGCFFC